MTVKNSLKSAGKVTTGGGPWAGVSGKVRPWRWMRRRGRVRGSGHPRKRQIPPPMRWGRNTHPSRRLRALAADCGGAKRAKARVLESCHATHNGEC